MGNLHPKFCDVLYVARNATWNEVRRYFVPSSVLGGLHRASGGVTLLVLEKDGIRFLSKAALKGGRQKLCTLR
jgi:hypothetical protein